MTFTEFKTKAEIETGFKCYEDTSNNQATFYGTSDKFEVFKTLAAGVILPTGTLAYLMDTGVNKIYSAYKKSSTAVDVVVKSFSREGQNPGETKLEMGKDIYSGDIMKYTGVSGASRGQTPSGIWVMIAYNGTEVLKTTAHQISDTTKTETLVDTINNKTVTHYIIGGSCTAGIAINLDLTRPTYPGTWY